MQSACILCRVSYWLDIPVVSPGKLQRLLGEGPSADKHVNRISGPASRKTTDLHVPPALEIGITESGQLAVSAAPALPAAAPSQHSTLDLALDFASLDTESMLLRATEANSGVQLGRRHSFMNSPLKVTWSFPRLNVALVQARIA